MYSLAALPSITRAAPAKKRRLSTMTGISSIAAPTGLPALRLSRRPSSSARASIASASLSRARLRSWGVVCCHVSNALAAALTARSTSSGPEAWTWAITWPLAGFSTSRVWPVGAVDPVAADELLVGRRLLEGVGHVAGSSGRSG